MGRGGFVFCTIFLLHQVPFLQVLAVWFCHFLGERDVDISSFISGPVPQFKGIDILLEFIFN
jgi:hypothetical protein